MLKSNITNLQFILDNKPQYSTSFDKQQKKKTGSSQQASTTAREQCSMAPPGSIQASS